MNKFYVSNENELNEEEKRTGKISYKKIIDRYIEDLVICNNITNLDESVWENMQNYFDNDNDYGIENQYFLCNLSEFEKQKLIDYGIILSYSDMLDLDVLCVDHFGTSWDYVMTDIEWTTNYEEIEK